MAKASINFQKTQSNSVAETTREFKADYLLPEEHRLENEYWNCGKSDSQVFEAELQKATRKGGRVPKEENSLWEGVLNLNKEHTLKDVQRVAKHIEEKFNITCTRIAVHKDEGHINERGIVEYNIHAHLNFVTYKDGKQNWRRENIKDGFIQLQTDIAQILKMERGKSKKETLAVHLPPKQQRAIAKEREAVQYSFREYQQRITALENTSAEDKKEIHKLNNLVKKGEATIQDLEKRLQEALESKKAPETIKDTPKEEKIDFRAILAPKIEYKTVEIKTGMFGSEKKEVLFKSQALDLEVYAEEQAKRAKALEEQNKRLIEKVNKAVELVNKSNSYNEKLLAENKELSPYKKAYNDLMAQLRAITKIDKLENIINAIKAKFSHTQEAKREEKPKTIFEQNMELVKEQTPELAKKELSDKEIRMKIAEEVQAKKKPTPSLLERVEALKAQGEKNTETVKEFNEEQKSKSRGGYCR